MDGGSNASGNGAERGFKWWLDQVTPDLKPNEPFVRKWRLMDVCHLRQTMAPAISVALHVHRTFFGPRIPFFAAQQFVHFLRSTDPETRRKAVRCGARYQVGGRPLIDINEALTTLATLDALDRGERARVQRRRPHVARPQARRVWAR